MRDFKPDRERIEPRIGADPLMDENPKPRRRAVVTESVSRRANDSRNEKKMQSEIREERDVLMENPTPRYSAGDMPVARPEPAARRERGYTKASPQGRKSRAEEPNTYRAGKRLGITWNFSWLNRRFAVGCLVIGLGVAIYWASGPIAKVFERPIKSVVVEGEFHLISKQRATELIGDEINGDFLQLDLMELKAALLSDPWVEKVTLNRRWPDTLVVKIIEQKPIARWGDGFLNQRGEIVRVENAGPLSGLPWLQGSEADAIEILQQYQDLSQILRSRGLDVLALKCDNKKSWRLTVKNHVEIAIGRDQVMEKIRRFVTVYDTHLSSVWSDVKAIDVRYTNGIAVRWVADSAMAKKYIKSPLQVGVPAPAATVNPQVH
ncbi:cell division protein FtsQ/DivIB [Cellvibrio mixtus]|uniref:cell division protein FtsQ/DivIB n=1 Tax=Cellvibrio mixtus TaxID=39650 RepID=UPI0005865CF0|nr:cell division protein FtsQ/DivIB [Cellvibrio mixtus]